MKKLLMLVTLGLLGCSPTPTPSASPPPAPVKVAEVPASTPTTPTIRGESFRVRTDFLGRPEVTFSLQANGIAVGNYNTEVLSDMTPFIRPGPNTIQIRWNLDKRMKRDDRAQILIESRRDDQDMWNAVFSREVNSLTREIQTQGTFTVLATPAPASQNPKS